MRTEWECCRLPRRSLYSSLYTSTLGCKQTDEHLRYFIRETVGLAQLVVMVRKKDKENRIGNVF